MFCFYPSVCPKSTFLLWEHAGNWRWDHPWTVSLGFYKKAGLPSLRAGLSQQPQPEQARSSPEPLTSTVTRTRQQPPQEQVSRPEAVTSTGKNTKEWPLREQAWARDFCRTRHDSGTSVGGGPNQRHLQEQTYTGFQGSTTEGANTNQRPLQARE